MTDDEFVGSSDITRIRIVKSILSDISGAYSGVDEVRRILCEIENECAELIPDTEEGQGE